MLISPKIITTLSHWLGYKPCVYEPIYNDTNQMLEELDKSFQKQIYGKGKQELKPCVKALKTTVDKLNEEVEQLTHQKDSKHVSVSRDKGSQ